MIGVDERTKENLQGVDFSLSFPVLVAYHTCDTEFVVIDGLRTVEEQRENIDRGVSWTLNSRHLTGHAIDFVPATFNWEDLEAFERVYNCISRYNSDLVWGGDWKVGDYGHIEIRRE